MAILVPFRVVLTEVLLPSVCVLEPFFWAWDWISVCVELEGHFGEI